MIVFNRRLEKKKLQVTSEEKQQNAIFIKISVFFPLSLALVRHKTKLIQNTITLTNK